MVISIRRRYESKLKSAPSVRQHELNEALYELAKVMRDVTAARLARAAKGPRAALAGAEEAARQIGAASQRAAKRAASRRAMAEAALGKRAAVRERAAPPPDPLAAEGQLRGRQRKALYAQLDAALDRDNFEAAAAIKSKLDEL